MHKYTQRAGPERNTGGRLEKVRAADHVRACVCARPLERSATARKMGRPLGRPVVLVDQLWNAVLFIDIGCEGLPTALKCARMSGL